MELGRRVRFLCSRRSSLELETLLLSYFDEKWEEMTVEERERFAKIVALEDPTLEGILFRGEAPPPGVSREMIEDIFAKK